jgi:hypothetical protein
MVGYYAVRQPGGVVNDCKPVDNAWGLPGLVICSGEVLGVNTIYMKASLESRSFAVWALPDSLERATRISDPYYSKPCLERS